MWLTSYLWPGNIALLECSWLTLVTGGPSPGREVSGETITSLCITGKASQKRWERLRWRQRKIKGQAWGIRLQRGKATLKTLVASCMLYISIGFQHFALGPLGDLFFDSRSLQQWVIQNNLRLQPRNQNSHLFWLTPTCHLSTSSLCNHLSLTDDFYLLSELAGNSGCVRRLLDSQFSLFLWW